MQLSRTIIISLLESAEKFPIDFDDAWKWLGYYNKQAAKKKLIHSFEEGFDFSSKWIKNPQRGRPSDQIVLTIDCFKSLGMMANTAKGREVRRYFLECEQQLRELQKTIKNNVESKEEAATNVTDKEGEEPLNLSLPPLRTLTDACVFFFSAGEWLANAKATVSAYRLFFTVMENEAYGDRPSTDELIAEAHISKSSFYKATKVLKRAKLLPFWVKSDTRDYLEFRIRDRLKLELNGEIEVNTEVGLIDLLTPKEVIEIKAIQHWKTALGHVIAKGQVYPTHGKRIHLFGTSDLAIAKIRTYCSPLHVSVTFEKVTAEQIAV